MEEYGQRVQDLAAKAYVDSPSHVFELHTCEAFLRGCQDTEIAWLALLKKPKTLNKAIQYTSKISFNGIPIQVQVKTTSILQSEVHRLDAVHLLGSVAKTATRRGICK